MNILIYETCENLTIYIKLKQNEAKKYKVKATLV